MLSISSSRHFPLVISVAHAVSVFVVAGCAQYAETARDQEPRSEQIVGPAGTLHVDDGGSGGIPVVLVHSFAGSSAHWSAQLTHLRENRRALALDLRGHGQSAPPSTPDYAIESLAADIGTVVDSLGLERFVLVGHSLGGAAAIAYTGANPDRVAGLVLVGAPGKIPEDQAGQIMTAIESDYDRVTQDYWNKLLTDARPEVRAQVSSEMGTVPKEASISIIRATFAYDPLPALGRYAGPSLVIATPSGDTPDDLHRLVPALPHKMMTGTSHWPHLDKPQEFNQLLDEFLTGIPPDGSAATPRQGR